MTRARLTCGSPAACAKVRLFLHRVLLVPYQPVQTKRTISHPPSYLTSDCNKAEIIIDRAHPDLSSVRPVVDLDKAKASLVDCASEMCTGTCTTEFLEDMGIKVRLESIRPFHPQPSSEFPIQTPTPSQSAFCGPHGGVCANLTKPRALQVR